VCQRSQLLSGWCCCAVVLLCCCAAARGMLWVYSIHGPPPPLLCCCCCCCWWSCGCGVPRCVCPVCCQCPLCNPALPWGEGRCFVHHTLQLCCCCCFCQHAAATAAAPRPPPVGCAGFAASPPAAVLLCHAFGVVTAIGIRSMLTWYSCAPPCAAVWGRVFVPSAWLGFFPLGGLPWCRMRGRRIIATTALGRPVGTSPRNKGPVTASCTDWPSVPSFYCLVSNILRGC
jgi:hypothetical protein